MFDDNGFDSLIGQGFNDLGGLLPVSTGSYDAANQEVMRLLQSRPQPTQMPGQVLPAFRTPDAIGAGIGLLSMLLGGKGGQEFGAGLLGGMGQAKQQKAQMDDRRNLQQWQLGNQQQENVWAGNLDAAKFGAGVEGDKLNRQFREQDREEDKAFREKQLEATQKGLNYRAEMKDDAKKVDQQIKAFSLRYGLSREAALDALYDQDMVSDELYTKLRPTIGAPTSGEAKDASQTKAIADKNKRDQEFHAKKLLDFDKKWKVWESQGKVRDAQITKWRADTARMNTAETRQRDQFEWRKKNPAGVSYIDRQIFNEQMQITQAMAELENLAAQGNGGFLQVETPQMKTAISNLQRQIAGSQARITEMQALGGTNSIEVKRQLAIDAITKYPRQEKAIRAQFRSDTGTDL